MTKAIDLMTPEEAVKELTKSLDALQGHGLPIQNLNRKKRRMLLAKAAKTAKRTPPPDK